MQFTTYEKTSFKEYVGGSFTKGFSGPKSFRDFRETGPCRPEVFLRKWIENCDVRVDLMLST